MSSLVISKIRCLNPSKKDTVYRNVGYFYYIAKKYHAMIDDRGNTVFGKINNCSLENEKLIDIKNYIKQISEKKTNIYQGIISIREKDALRLGYDEKEKWEELAMAKMYDIGKELGIQMNNVEFVSVPHLKKGNIHMHYMLWDKNQEILDYKISNYKQNKIRKDLIKYVCEDELQILYEEKNRIKSNLRSEVITLEMKAFNSRACLGKLCYSNIPKEELKELKNCYKEIKKHINKNGRLSYQFMPPEVKVEINNFVKKFININDELKYECLKFRDISFKVGTFYSKKESVKYLKKCEEQIENILGNRLLKSIKIADFEEWQEKILINNLLQSLFRIISIELESQNSKYLLLTKYRKEMSKEAKIEFIKSKQFSEHEEWREIQ